MSVYIVLYVFTFWESPDSLVSNSGNLLTSRRGRDYLVVTLQYVGFIYPIEPTF